MTATGTLEYLAPEMLAKQGYGKPVDWWGLGVLAYEFVVGATPFVHSSTPIMFERIQNNDVTFPSGMFTPEAQDLIKQLLTKEPSKRYERMIMMCVCVCVWRWMAGCGCGSGRRV